MKNAFFFFLFIVSFYLVGQETLSIPSQSVVATSIDSSSTKVSGEGDIIINPKPVKNYLGIKVAEDLSGYYQYRLVDHNGKCNSSGHIYLNDVENTIRVKNLENGSYNLHVLGNGINSIQKIEIKK